MKRSLNEIEEDMLRETANIGAGHASMSLSEIIKRKVELVISKLELIPIDELESKIGGPKKTVIGISATVVGEIKGCILIILQKESALCLSEIMQGKNPHTIELLGEKEEGLLKNVGKAMTTAYINALGRFLDVAAEEPRVIATFGQSIADIMLLTIDPEMTEAILIENGFNIENTVVQGTFILLLAGKSVDKLLKKMTSNDEAFEARE